jgi:hypothetical protein
MSSLEGNYRIESSSQHFLISYKYVTYSVTLLLLLLLLLLFGSSSSNVSNNSNTKS